MSLEIPKRFDDSIKEEQVYLKPPYARVIISLQRVNGDELHQTAEGLPIVQHLSNCQGDYENLVVVNKALSSLGLGPVKDPAPIVEGKPDKKYKSIKS